MRFFHGGGRRNRSKIRSEGIAKSPFWPGRQPKVARNPGRAKLDLLRLGVLPLTMVAPEEPVRLVEIMARGRLRHRLTELGLTPGVELKVLQNKGGPLLLAVHNTRLALGRGMAHKIMVQAVSEDVASD